MKLIACAIAVLCMITGIARAQEPSADSVGIHYITHLRAGDKQAIFLETDRNIYAAGEKIWFSALLLDELDKKVDTSSKNLFVDLVNDNDSVLSKLVLNAAALRTAGAITLSDSLPTGNYWLRGYTQNIIANSPAGAGVKLLYIVNRRTPAPDLPAAGNAALQPVIRFYPEGGTLITGASSTGALQVTDAEGNPLLAQGSVVTAGASGDSAVCSFTTNRFGLARVSFYPVWYKKYTAVITVNGNVIKYPLPAYNPYAVQLAVASQSAGNVLVHVAMEDSIYSRRFVTYLLAVNGAHVYFAAVGHGMYTHEIPVANVPGGITTLLLFDGREQLLSARSIFINKQNYSIDIKANKPNYAARDYAHFDIDTKDGGGNPVVAELNISVQDDRIMKVCDEMQGDSIMPPLGNGLSQWLKRYGAGLSAQDIDLLVLAQQPVNYSALAGTVKTAIVDSAFLLQNLVGKITDKKSVPLKDKVVTAMLLAKTSNFFDADTTRADGSFSIPLKQVTQNEPLQLQVTGKRNIAEGNVVITIDTFRFPQFATPPILKKRYTLVNAMATQQLQKYTTDTFYNYIGKGWLKPVTVTAIAKAKPNYDVSKRLSPFSHLVTSDALGNGGTGMVGNAVLRVPGISMMGGKIVLRGPSGSKIEEPLVVMDGVPVRIDDDSETMSPTINFLNTLNYETIDFIEVLEGPEAAVYGSRASNGVISVITKFPDNKNYGPGFKIVRPVMYHTTPPFDMPDYSNKTIRANKSPDPRTTIYWEGNLITTKDGKATVDFYTADEPTTYSVVVTGITQTGEYIYKRITVSRK